MIRKNDKPRHLWFVEVKLIHLSKRDGVNRWALADDRPSFTRRAAREERDRFKRYAQYTGPYRVSKFMRSERSV